MRRVCDEIGGRFRLLKPRRGSIFRAELMTFPDLSRLKKQARVDIGYTQLLVIRESMKLH
jgi:hypothetical protein